MPPKPEVIRRQLSVHLARTCNLYCEYCQAPPDGGCQGRAEIKAAIKKGGYTAVSLEGGGEPTTAPDLFEWIAFLKSCGIKSFMLSTNAVALADPALARRLRFIHSFIVNFPACDERTYKKVTRSVKFPLALKGLENLRALGLAGRVRLFHIISAHNYTRLPAFADWVAKSYPEAGFVNFIFMRNVGRAASSRENLLPTYTRAMPRLKIALAKLKLKGIKCVIQNTPLCVLGSFRGFSFELQRWRRGDPVLPHNAAPKAKLPACAKCRLEPACCGARPDYLAVHGSRELSAQDLDPASIKPEAF
ncbi:MAG: hypothetical protein A2049_02395 [Elusimicrobia bacterium GWA2_62_23]|nr:MAG: hypothetical protein A2049_02395 [Elusimicrobia bacterium GWA2_62_23]OGR72352.1 MAG: hypothetical protein A2179_02490 [Elusimicrobia bacterium GWC2_63_65]